MSRDKTIGSFTVEVSTGQRFEFGKNWQRYAKALTPERIADAVESLRSMLGVEDLVGMSMLDIGSGSGLFSLAARRLGAHVHSFDYDPQSVACTQMLKERFFPGDEEWVVEEGSALDPDYLRSLGKFDIVYSWGVLHHTGAMWQALENATLPVAKDGRLFIAIYNTLPKWTRLHTWMKRSYVKSPLPGKWLIAGGCIASHICEGFLLDVLRLRNPLARYRAYQTRGMSRWHDMIDWVGGYPFETATVNQIFDFYRLRGFSLERLNANNGSGCSEFVLRKTADANVLANSLPTAA